MKRHACLLGVLALLCLSASSAWAQETRGSIEGVVKDASGAVLPGATVEARSPSLVGIQSTTSDGNGIYRFPALSPGIYEVSATLSGFTTKKVADIQLNLGQTLKVDFSLPIAGMTESVQVTAESPLIDVKGNAASVSIQADVIDRIPKGRDFTSVINSAPGTSANEARGGGTMVDGSSASENRFIVDGLDTTNLRTGTSSSDVPIDFLEQVQVKSSGYNAEYRAATGGVVSAITKSGSNTLHGTAGTYYSDNKYRGDIRKSLRLNPTNNLLAEYITVPRDKGHSYDPIFDIGGPVLRDKAWFYVGYNPRRSWNQRTATFTQNVPDGGSQTRTFENSNGITPEDNFLRYTLTGQVSHNIRARFAGANEWTKGGIAFPALEPNSTSTSNPRTFILPSASCINTVCNPNALQRSDFRDDQATGVIDWVVNSKTYINVTTSRLFYGSHNAGAEQNNNIVRTFSGSNVGLLDVPASLQQPNGYADGPGNAWAVKDNYGRFNVNADVTRYAHFKGEHAFKAGFQWERITNDVDTGQRAPNIALSWDATRTTLSNTQVRGKYGYYLVNRIFTQGAIHANNNGVFFQDAWTLNRKLTLNYGVRTESEDIPSYSPADPGVHFGWSDKIAPRLGFAYDVKGDSQWKVYGSWGVFNDITKLEMPRGSWGADHWLLYYYTLDTPNWPSISCDGPPGSGCPGTFIEQVDNRHPSNDRNNPLIDPNLKPVRTQELTGGFDHELARTMSFGIRYSHKWLDRTIEDVGIAVPGVGEVFYIANPGFGIAQHILGDQFPTTPKAKRIYDGVEFRLRKRLANRWSTDSSFLISRLYGNYSGLASSDENGRTSPNVDRLFDGLYMSFDETGKPLYGRLATDRPFTFKTQTTYDLPWGTGLGVFFYAASGQPLTSSVTVVGVPVFYKGRGDLGRLPTFMQTDLNIQHGFRMAGHTRAEVELNVNNLFDQSIGTQITNTPYRDAIPTNQNTGFFNGVNIDAIAAATPSIRRDPRFRQLSGFEGERTMRLMVKFNF
jgi:Carboxypeptidase regulatory-like domain/TonB-dependent Receptor Plug Domain